MRIRRLRRESFKKIAESFSETISKEAFCIGRADCVLGLFVNQSGNTEDETHLIKTE